MAIIAQFPWQQRELDQMSALVCVAGGHTAAWPNGLLLAGAPGMGQLLCLQQLASALLCQVNVRVGFERLESSCGQCASCRLIQAGHHPDYCEVLAEHSQQPIKIESIRALKASIALTPKTAPHRLVVIGPIDQFTEGAANALLKSLEEPPHGTYFLMFTERLAQVKSTLLSRCRLLRMSVPGLTGVSDWLQGLGYEAGDFAQLRLLYDLYGGAPMAIKAALDDRLIESLRAWSKFLGSMSHASLYDALLEARAWVKVVSATVLLTWTQLWLRGLLKNKLFRHLTADADNPKLSHFFSVFNWLSHQKALIAEVPQLNQQRLIEQLVIRWHQMSCYTQ